MSNDFKKHIQLIESIGMREDEYEDEFNLDPTETPDGEYDMSLDDTGYDVDDELDMEIARSDVEDMDMGGEEDYAYDEPDMMDMEPELDAVGAESDDPIFNYTATIQIHGYDFPLVLQADDMDEIKTVMQVLKQSGLNPKGDYKWNSKTFEIDLDESTKSKKTPSKMMVKENLDEIAGFSFLVRPREEYDSSNESIASKILQYARESLVNLKDDNELEIDVEMKDARNGYSLLFHVTDNSEFSGSSSAAERELRNITDEVYKDVKDFVKSNEYNFALGSINLVESVTESSEDDNWAYDEGYEAGKSDAKMTIGSYIGDPKQTVKDDKDMSYDEKREYMKGYKKAVDDKGLKCAGSGEKFHLTEK